MKKASNDKKNKGFLVSELAEIEKRENEIPFINFYPRPKLKRNNFTILNGEWDIDISKNSDLPAKYIKKVVVPYPIESPDSLVNHLLEPDEYIFYHREIKYDLKDGKRAILHFEGIDQIAEIFINNEFVEKHIGGYTSFSLDVTNFLSKGSFDLSIRVQDVTDQSYHQRGKQTLKPSFCFYSSSSGIYKTVWLEEVPEKYIYDVAYQSIFDENGLKIHIKTKEDGNAKISIEGETFVIPTNKDNLITLKNVPIWSITCPNLLNIDIEYCDDVVKTYYAYRKFEVKNGENRGFFLNNEKIILNGLLDQGYYFPNGLTPRSYKDYEFDILRLKELGFNTIRKHIKVEDEYFYYLCDKYGMLVLQDLPNGGEPYKFISVGFPRLSIKLLNKEKYLNEKNVGRGNALGNKEFINDSLSIISKLNNYGCIIGYTVFNEGWGQFKTSEVYNILRPNIKNRFVDLTSGWYQSTDNEVFSIHAYTYQTRDRQDIYKDRPYFLSEFGGLGLKVKDHSLYPGEFSHRGSKTKAALTKKYVGIFNNLIKNLKKGHIAGMIYTQVADCETEYNGIFTFDRKILKIDEKIIKEINEKIHPY